MSDVAATGVTVPQTGSGGWIDGFRDLFFGAANGYLSREFPEQTESDNTNQVVNDTAVVEQDAANGTLSTNQMLLIGGGGLAVVLLVVVLTR